MQLGEMQYFNNTPLGEMQSGEMQLSHMEVRFIAYELYSEFIYSFYFLNISFSFHVTILIVIMF